MTNSLIGKTINGVEFDRHYQYGRGPEDLSVERLRFTDGTSLTNYAVMAGINDSEPYVRTVLEPAPACNHPLYILFETEPYYRCMLCSHTTNDVGTQRILSAEEWMAIQMRSKGGVK